MGGGSSKSKVSQSVTNMVKSVIDNTQICSETADQTQKQKCNLKFDNCTNITAECSQTIQANLDCIAETTVTQLVESVINEAARSSVSDSKLLNMPWGPTTRSEISSQATNISDQIYSDLKTCDAAYNQNQTQEFTLDCQKSSKIVAKAAQKMGANAACKLVAMENFSTKVASQLFSDSSVKSGLSTAVIIIIVVVCIVALAAIIIGVYYGTRKKRGGGGGGSNVIAAAPAAQVQAPPPPPAPAAQIPAPIPAPIPVPSSTLPSAPLPSATPSTGGLGSSYRRAFSRMR
jgi:hypothetical protein